MAIRSTDRGDAGSRSVRWGAAGAVGLILSAALAAQAPQVGPGDPGARAAARARALQEETDRLAKQESTLLGELRKLEIERQLKTTELSAAQTRRATVAAEAEAAAARARALEQAVAAERPEIARRLTRVYTMGRGGFWRLLLDVDSLRAMGRAYRTAAALGEIDRKRVLDHQRKVEALAVQRAQLATALQEITALEAAARRARDGVVKAVASRTALVASIDARRDLNAQLIGELRAAQERLQSSVSQLAGGPAVVLPLKAFKGALPWPAAGPVTIPFGRPSGAAGATGRNGIDLGVAEGQPALAVHEGTVAYADAFTGYGLLVIVEHGTETFSLYGYLDELAVRKGDKVAARQAVGRTGQDPAGKPALYFELRVDGRAVDPLQWMVRR
jgi:murein hydrolase activator